MSNKSVFFTESHEWIQVEGSCGTVGISSYAQKELGEIVAIELPKVGSLVQAGDEVCVLESTKAAADIYSPVSGRILSINENLVKNPHALNIEPELRGWLFRIELSNPSEVERLLTASSYEDLISKSS